MFDLAVLGLQVDLMIFMVFSNLNDSVFCSTNCRSLEKVLGGKKGNQHVWSFLSRGIFQLNSIKHKITWIVKDSYMYMLTSKSYTRYMSLPD